MPPRDQKSAARQAAAQAAEAAGQAAPAAGKRARRGSDPITGELRRRDVLPLLVLHYINDGPCYGNQLMERIAALTEGVLHVNPNTMYPLLRDLESRGLIEGTWEHPDRRSRRYYAITDAGAQEYEDLLEDVLPFLGALARSLDGIFGEIYGEG
ncbi:MAG TPA: PadR family transcriptional regulator [Thermoleophilaceae bacterium]|nr:PadR family transcriptional regulator [Thermoleophilaceae bacterium]